MTPRPPLLLAAGALLGLGAAAFLAWPGTASETSVAPTDAGCDPVGAMVVSGDQEAQRWTSLPPGAAIAARGAVWSGSDDRPGHVDGGEGLCWEGGEIRGTFDDEVTWEELHGTGAFNLFVPGSTVAGLRIHNYGDGIRVLDGAGGFRILDVHLSFVRDDCIENDDVRGGVVRGALLDGCYVAFSARPWQEDFAGDDSERTLRIEDSLVRLEPTPTVYRGRAPGHGGFFKWDREGRSPQLVLEGNVFRADQDPNHTSMGIPEGTTCRDNTMVWSGDGPYAAPLPDCFEVTTDRRVWDRAVFSPMARRTLNVGHGGHRSTDLRIRAIRSSVRVGSVPSTSHTSTPIAAPGTGPASTASTTASAPSRAVASAVASRCSARLSPVPRSARRSPAMDAGTRRRTTTWGRTRHPSRTTSR